MGGFEKGDIAWFLNGKLNASTNCIDRHLEKRGDQVAIIWEADEPGQSRKITYRELHHEVCRLANAMKTAGVKKGDTVAIYMPMVPELAFTMLACARIGAPHSIVFAGFSAEALRDRIVNASSKWVFVTDEGYRGGRTLPLKKTVDAACAGVDVVEKVFVFKRSGADVPMTEGRDVYMEELMDAERPYCPAEPMDSEDLLFILYTSGSTGSPKGVGHTTAGYLLYSQMTTKNVFDLRENDVYACVADCGWITGHTYIVYGPLLNGTTTLMFESTPLYPNASRYWDLVETHKVTQFYTAPTAIRALMQRGEEPVQKNDISSLRILGSVGEPINPEAWRWYFEVVGKSKCAIVDTYWQTETGGHIGTPLPGCTPMKPGSCSLPFFGVDFAIMDDKGNELVGNEVEGKLCVRSPWPGITRTVYGDHKRYLNVYMTAYPGMYFTGDGCKRDKDGYYWITGRVDDVVNTSGHRIGTAEIESALVAHAAVGEAAVIGFPHPVKGEGLCCYVSLNQGVEETENLCKDLKMAVRAAIGAFATPDHIIVSSGLPKTRSGKIMRRVLRKIIAGEAKTLGDVSTLADPSVVGTLIDKVLSSAGVKQD
jgi:acetyl-CoA synthetase